MTFFKEFFKVIMLNLRMSDAVSLHLMFICLPYALFLSKVIRDICLCLQSKIELWT